MKCSVCFKQLRKRSGVCPYCFYSADDLTLVAPKAHINVVRSSSYQAFAEMLKKYDGLDCVELRMKIYCDSNDRQNLLKLLKSLYKEVVERMKSTGLSPKTRLILEARHKGLVSKIKRLQSPS